MALLIVWRILFIEMAYMGYKKMRGPIPLYFLAQLTIVNLATGKRERESLRIVKC